MENYVSILKERRNSETNTILINFFYCFFFSFRHFILMHKNMISPILFS